MPKGSFELIFDHETLNSNKTLSDYNIYYCSKIYLVVEQKYEKFLFKQDSFSVYYRARCYTVGIENNTILGIKEYFNESIFNGEIPIEKMKIIFRGKILDNKINFEDEGLGAKSLELITID